MMDFILSIISVTSSTTPGILVNSCFTPLILTEVTALPSRDDNKTLRRLLPIVIPYPLSKGSAVNFPYVPLSVSWSTVMRAGSSKPLHRIRIRTSHLKAYIDLREAFSTLFAHLISNRVQRPTALVQKQKPLPLQAI